VCRLVCAALLLVSYKQSGFLHLLGKPFDNAVLREALVASKEASH
jgi:hypothetical protein